MLLPNPRSETDAQARLDISADIRANWLMFAFEARNTAAGRCLTSTVGCNAPQPDENGNSVPGAEVAAPYRCGSALEEPCASRKRGDTDEPAAEMDCSKLATMLLLGGLNESSPIVDISLTSWRPAFECNF